jgi:hypothetical protein
MAGRERGGCCRRTSVRRVRTPRAAWVASANGGECYSPTPPAAPRYLRAAPPPRAPLSLPHAAWPTAVPIMSHRRVPLPDAALVLKLKRRCRTTSAQQIASWTSTRVSTHHCPNSASAGARSRDVHRILGDVCHPELPYCASPRPAKFDPATDRVRGCAQCSTPRRAESSPRRPPPTTAWRSRRPSGRSRAPPRPFRQSRPRLQGKETRTARAGGGPTSTTTHRDRPPLTECSRAATRR